MIEDSPVVPQSSEPQSVPEELTSGTTAEAGPSRPSAGPRSIFAYFGNGSGPSKPADAGGSSGQQVKKRRRKHDPAQGKQARLNGLGKALIVGHDGEESGLSDASLAGKGSKSKKGKKLGGEEEEEMREMVKRQKAVAQSSKKAVKVAQDEQATDDAQITGDGKGIEGLTTGGGALQSSRSIGDASGIGATLNGAANESRSSSNPTQLVRTRKTARGGKQTSSSEIDRSRASSHTSTIASNRSGTSRSPQRTVDLVSSETLRDLDVADINTPTNRNRRSSDVVITGIKFERPSHSFFSRASSNATAGSSKGASQQDAINVDVPLSIEPVKKGKSGPRKLVFVADQKPAHGFFAKLANGEKLSSRASSMGPDTAKAAAHGADPAMNLGASKPSGKVHAFFNGTAKGNSQAGQPKEGWGGGIKAGEEWLAPFPGRQWPQHVEATCGGPTLPLERVAPSRKRRKVQPSGSGVLSDFFYDSSTPVKTSEHRSQTPNHWFNAFASSAHAGNHPAILAVKQQSGKPTRESWCDYYRPRRACEVLGNETESTYLRDWLEALSVRQDDRSHTVNGIRRTHARITRRVPRRKDVNWIIDDFDEWPDPAELEGGIEEAFEVIESGPSPWGGRPTSYPALDSRLGNCILLTGPHGCGKSAAVYAAAEELGWEVFEVYPGIGKRTGTNLMSLVGEVGRNHIVTTGKSPRKGQEKARIATLLGSITNHTPPSSPIPSRATKRRKRANQLPMSSQGSQGDPIPLHEDDDADSEEEVVPIDLVEKDLSRRFQNGVDHPSPEPGRTPAAQIEREIAQPKQGFKQSLILFDEVDLLYDEETTFWPAVISLIAESRRPVVLTCNDATLVPNTSLPLQTILQFQSPHRDLAMSHLSTIAEKQGLALSSDDIAHFYTSAFSGAVDILDQPLPPNGNEPVQHFDLRRAISQMQLDRHHAVLYDDGQLHAIRQKKHLEQVTSRWELRSFGDAWVGSRDASTMEITEIDRYGPSSDDVLGYTTLIKPREPEERPCLGINELSQSMYDTLLAFSWPVPGDNEADQLRYAQMSHIRSLLPILDPLIPLAANLLPHHTLFTTYIPTLQSIIHADDLMQIAEEEATKRGEERLNKKTGRPMRLTALLSDGNGKAEYVRYLRVSKEAEDVVRRLKFDGMEGVE